jgi:pimeloyl-ACP methyl ester carboxylesterase
MCRFNDYLIGLIVALAVSLGTAPAGDVAGPRLYTDSQLVVRDRFSDEIVGAGPDVVFIPGLASSRATWKATADRLKSRYRIHLIQVAGFAGEPVRGNAAGELVVPTAEAIDAYLVEQHLVPATLIGHSLGGTMSLYLAEHHPDHLKKIFIADAIPLAAFLVGGPTATAASVKPMADAIRASTAPQPNPDQMIAHMVTSPDNRAMVVGWTLASDPGAVNRAFADDIVLDLQPGLATIPVPITMVYPEDVAAGQPKGSMDAVYGSLYAAAPHKTMVRIDDSLHFMMLDQPAAFAAALDAFLKS